MDTNIPLKRLTTLKIGGSARYFSAAGSEDELSALIDAATREGLRWYVIGQGSNLVPADGGFRGLVIQNVIEGVERNGEIVCVGAGHDLFDFIRCLNRAGLAGMERMAGIPGTVGGAIYGNAGAYGQEVKDRLVSVRIFDGRKIQELPREKLKLAYRESIFKKRPDWIIFSAKFRLRHWNPKKLKRTSKQIVSLREQKYHPGLACPGSFFKNIVLADLPRKKCEHLLSNIPKDKVMYGKVPTGYLLEVVSAKGIKRGGIQIAPHHANLFYNAGEGTAADIRYLARLLRTRVEKQFGITLEEEVQYLPY